MKNKFTLLSLLFVLVFTSKEIIAQQALADSLINLLPRYGNDTAKVNLLNKISRALETERSSLTQKYATEALTLSRAIDYKQGEALALRYIGFAEENNSNFSQAINYYEQSAKIFTEINDTSGQARSISNIANAEYYLGDYTSSAQHAMEAIKLHELTANYSGLVSSHLALGNVYADQTLYDQALSQYRIALAYTPKVSDCPDCDARVYASIGNIYQYEQAYDSSLYYYKKALDIFQSQGAEFEASVCFNNISTVYRSQKKLDEAESYLRKSLSVRRVLGDTNGVCSVYQNLSGIAADRGKYDSSLYYIQYAYYLSGLVGSQSQKLKCYQGLAESYHLLHRYDSAYSYLNLYTTLKDSLFSEENLEAMNQLRNRYNNEKQQARLSLIESEYKAEQAQSRRNIFLLLSVGLFAVLIAAILFYRNRVKQMANENLERQNVEISKQKQAITDSINYAKRIQDAILPPKDDVRRILPESFIFYLPKDVVSGDFYWVEQRENKSIFAAVDCTGHGVPGALMSVVGFNLLNQAVNELGLTKPSDILHHLDYGVNKLLRQSNTENSVKDGMDLALCTYDAQEGTLQFAGVFNPIYIISEKNITEIKADKFPIGMNINEVADSYTNHEIKVDKEKMVYLFTDGFADQFGGSSGKKYKYKKLREFLTHISSLPCTVQHEMLAAEFNSWKGNLDQVDDVLIIGVRIG